MCVCEIERFSAATVKRVTYNITFYNIIRTRRRVVSNRRRIRPGRPYLYMCIHRAADTRGNDEKTIIIKKRKT